jgi:hypothetical protein
LSALFEQISAIEWRPREKAQKTESGDIMKKPRRGLTLEQAIRELERLGTEVRNMATQLASLRARVTDLEQWEKSIATVSLRKHIGVRKHIKKAPSLRKARR